MSTRSIPRLALALVVVALPFVASCGGGMAMQRPEARPDPQREIDEQEARMRAAEQELEQAGPACERSCHAGASICDAARRICDLASELGDLRSQSRCESAQASCVQANDRLTTCHCADGDADAGRVKSAR